MIIPAQKDISHIHLIGIGGIGMRALARIFSSRGVTVSGSDVSDLSDDPFFSAIGVTPHRGHDVSHVPVDAELIIYSPAVGEDNPERMEAHTRDIPELSYPQALGWLMEEKRGIAISGTNGKTTTTALTGHLFAACDMDPTVVVGGVVSAWGSNVREGASDLFIAEACEYRRNMLSLAPETIILTNIEADHLDYYQDIDDIVDAFRSFVHTLPEDGLLIYNADDDRLKKLARELSVRTIGFGFSDDSDVCIRDFTHRPQGETFTLHTQAGAHTFTTPLAGAYNVSNAAAAIIAARAYGVSDACIAETLPTFAGVGRRFEYLGAYKDAPLFSDYAHHPDALSRVLTAARHRYPNGRIVAVFQPHQRDRTEKLFDAFVDAFSDADEVILPPIYEVAGRNESHIGIDSKQLADAISRAHPDIQTTYAKDWDAVTATLTTTAAQADAILFIGAGTIDGFARTFAAQYSEN